ncbi:MAG: hypothetical protein MUF87_12360 [Anaerolineae bacterium]|nr:hypothetical protein [Anaerolineae bacterium]
MYRIAPVWSPDGTLIATVGATSVDIWNTDTTSPTLLTTLSIDSASALAWHPTDRLLAIAKTDYQIQLWDILQTQLIDTVTTTITSPIISLTWTQNGSMLIYGTDPETSPATFVWDLQTERLMTTFASPGFDLTIDPSGLYLLHGGSNAKVWNMNHFGLEAEFDTPQDTNNFATSVGWSPDSTSLITGGMNGAVYVWELNNSLQPRLFFAGSPAYQPVNGAASIYIPYEQLVQTWIRDVAFTADGQRVVSVAADGTTQMWELNLTQQIKIQQLPVILGAAWSPHAVRLAYFEADRAIINASDVTIAPLQIAVPFASQAQWSALADVCLTSTQSRADLDSLLQNENYDQLETALVALPDDAIPSACRADLIAIAQALRS